MRKSRANTDVNDLTRDGYHLSLTLGRYTAACTWFEALIRPVFGVSVKKNPCRLQGTDFELSADAARLCRKTAAKAVRNRR